MELINEFTVDVSVDEAWNVLTDVRRIAPCMPGAQLDSVEGDEYHGAVKVKVGPISAVYKGKAVFLERDSEVHRAVLKAEGREARGQGNASATIAAELKPAGTSTHVSVTTDLVISGRVAQFGRGVLADVSSKLLRQFVDSLEATVLGGTSAVGADSGTGAVPGDNGQPTAGQGSSRSEVLPAAESLDLVRVVGSVVVKRCARAISAVVSVLFFWRRLPRRVPNR